MLLPPRAHGSGQRRDLSALFAVPIGANRTPLGAEEKPCESPSPHSSAWRWTDDRDGRKSVADSEASMQGAAPQEARTASCSVRVTKPL